MTAYHKKPVPVLPDHADAIQITWNSYPQLKALVNKNAWRNGTTSIEHVSSTCGEPGPRYISLRVPSPDGGEVDARHGDWLIAGDVPGSFVPVAPDVFNVTYEPVAA